MTRPRNGVSEMCLVRLCGADTWGRPLPETQASPPLSPRGPLTRLPMAFGASWRVVQCFCSDVLSGFTPSVGFPAFFPLGFRSDSLEYVPFIC